MPFTQLSTIVLMGTGGICNETYEFLMYTTLTPAGNFSLSGNNFGAIPIRVQYT